MPDPHPGPERTDLEVRLAWPPPEGSAEEPPRLERAAGLRGAGQLTELAVRLERLRTLVAVLVVACVLAVGIAVAAMLAAR